MEMQIWRLVDTVREGMENVAETYVLYHVKQVTGKKLLYNTAGPARCSVMT